MSTEIRKAQAKQNQQPFPPTKKSNPSQNKITPQINQKPNPEPYVYWLLGASFTQLLKQDHQKDGRETNHAMRKAPQPSKPHLQAKQKLKQAICELYKVNDGDVLPTEILGLIWLHELALGTSCSPLQFSSLASQSPPRQRRDLLLHFSPY